MLSFAHTAYLVYYSTHTRKKQGSHLQIIFKLYGRFFDKTLDIIFALCYHLCQTDEKEQVGYVLPSKRAADGEIAVCVDVIEWAFEGELKHSRQDGVGTSLTKVGIFRMRKVGEFFAKQGGTARERLLSPQKYGGQEFFYFRPEKKE